MLGVTTTAMQINQTISESLLAAHGTGKPNLWETERQRSFRPNGFETSSDEMILL